MTKKKRTNTRKSKPSLPARVVAFPGLKADEIGDPAMAEWLSTTSFVGPIRNWEEAPETDGDDDD